MSPRSNRVALLAVALIGFVVGVVASVRFDLFPRSEAINLFGGADKPSSGSPPAPPPVVALPDFAGLAEHEGREGDRLVRARLLGTGRSRRLRRRLGRGRRLFRRARTCLTGLGEPAAVLHLESAALLVVLVHG